LHRLNYISVKYTNISLLSQVAPAPLLQHFQLDYEECTFINAEYDVVVYGT
jgi:hypothetical protein